MQSRERVQAAFAFRQPDATPCDYYATPEIHSALLKHFRISDDNELRNCLGTDIRFVDPPYIGPELPVYEDGSVMNIWGIRKKPMANEYGDYYESVNFPYAGWKTVEETESFAWPSPDWYDHGAVPAICDQYPGKALLTGAFAVQDFINGAAFGRGVEQTLVDIALEDPVFVYIVEKRHRFYLEFIERTLAAAGGKLDIVLCGDDFGSQRGLILSPASFDRLFADKKRKFHGRIVLHGAVDVQGWLQRAAPSEIEKEINHLIDEVGKDGGFIVAPCHQIQPDTPLENVLTLYRTLAKRRGEKVNPLLLMG
jgi:uroporphyrinogen decarboxylase